MHTIGIAFSCDATDIQLLPALKEYGRKNLGGLIISNFGLTHEACASIAKEYEYESLTVFKGIDGHRHDNVIGLLKKSVYEVKFDGLVFSEICNPFDSFHSSIRNLNISNTNLDENAIKCFLKRNSALEWLTCNNTNMTLKSVELACEIKTLKYIGIKGCGINMGDLMGVEIPPRLQVGI